MNEKNSALFRRGFTNDAFMHPSLDMAKYKDRDYLVGKRESERRLKLFPLISEKAIELAKNLSVDVPVLKVKGSVAVGMAVEDSDLDIAVIVDHSHAFNSQSHLWRAFQDGLEALDFGFRIEARLVISSLLDGN